MVYRGGALVARKAHNLEEGGSIPPPGKLANGMVLRYAPRSPISNEQKNNFVGTDNKPLLRDGLVRTAW